MRIYICLITTALPRNHLLKNLDIWNFPDKTRSVYMQLFWAFCLDTKNVVRYCFFLNQGATATIGLFLCFLENVLDNTLSLLLLKTSQVNVCLTATKYNERKQFHPPFKPPKLNILTLYRLWIKSKLIQLFVYLFMFSETIFHCTRLRKDIQWSR